MTPETVTTLAHEAMYIALLLAAPPLFVGLVVGLVVSLFQAATQINEQTMSFLPRLVVTLIALAFAGPWVLERVMHYTVEIFQRAAQTVV